MTNTIRRDILTAVPVAFHQDGRLDLPGSREILENIKTSGVQGVLIMGTTGEFPSLSIEERRQLTELSVEVLDNMRVVAHVGAASLFEVRRLIADAREVGVTSVAVLTPYYLPASDEALVDFYRGVSEASDGLEVYVYIFTARTGITVTPALLAELATLPNIVGAKLSGESLDQVAAYRAAVGANFELFTGADIDLARAADYGAQGVISGIASVFPKPFVCLVAALNSGDSARIEEAQLAVNDVVATVVGDPARMKAGLRLQGINAGYARMALDEPNADVTADLQRAVSLYA